MPKLHTISEIDAWKCVHLEYLFRLLHIRKKKNDLKISQKRRLSLDVCNFWMRIIECWNINVDVSQTNLLAYTVPFNCQYLHVCTKQEFLSTHGFHQRINSVTFVWNHNTLNEANRKHHHVYSTCLAVYSFYTNADVRE